MAEYVRVRDRETGHHVSIPRARFESNRELWQELKQPAADAGGTLLPPKYKTSVSTEADKKAGESADTKKES